MWEEWVDRACLLTLGQATPWFFCMLKWIQGALEMDEHIGFECENSRVSSSAQWLSQDPHTCHCWNPYEGLNVYIASAFDLPFNFPFCPWSLRIFESIFLKHLFSLWLECQEDVKLHSSYHRGRLRPFTVTKHLHLWKIIGADTTLIFLPLYSLVGLVDLYRFYGTNIKVVTTPPREEKWQIHILDVWISREENKHTSLVEERNCKMLLPLIAKWDCECPGRGLGWRWCLVHRP